MEGEEDKSLKCWGWVGLTGCKASVLVVTLSYKHWDVICSSAR